MKKKKKKTKTDSRPKKHRWGCGCLILLVLVVIVPILYSFFTVSFFTPDDEWVNRAKRHLPSDARYIIMVDFSKPSAQERLYVYDIDEADFVYSGVVQHGLGRGSTARHPEFSNELGSRCSSLGLYRVSEFSKINRIKEKDIPCFRLDGLSATNSNARRRGILIHPSLTATLLPFEIWGVALPLTRESEGCFAVSWHTMLKIAKLNLEGDMYLYAYDGEASPQ